MPLYDYLCPAGHHSSRFTTVANHSPITVCDCGEMAQQVISVPAAITIQPECRYDSPIDGTPITTWAARANDLARSNCEPYDPGRKEDYQRRIQDQEKAVDRSVDEAVGLAVARMDTQTRGKLYSELVDQNKGIDVVRR
jgi:hypothetical protein